MNAKLRADFINSVAVGQRIPCPSCNTLNDSNAGYCTTCGHPLNGAAAGLEEKKIICPICSTENLSGSPFCVACGLKFEDAQMSSQSDQQKGSQVPAFNSVSSEEKSQVAATSQNNSSAGGRVFKYAETVVVDEEEASVFAQGLPAWNIVPPQIMVRRKVKR